MPPAVVKTLSDALSQVLAQQDFKDKLSSEAVALLPLSPDAFTAYVKADIERWSKLAKERKIELES
jgi:tripartite-type tricarboxylate transporter receptor subunit TctC